MVETPAEGWTGKWGRRIGSGREKARSRVGGGSPLKSFAEFGRGSARSVNGYSVDQSVLPERG
jgi:hypothetical protein